MVPKFSLMLRPISRNCWIVYPEREEIVSGESAHAAGLVVEDGFADLLGGVHNEGALADDGFAKWFSGENEQARGGLSSEANPIPFGIEGDEFDGCDGGIVDQKVA